MAENPDEDTYFDELITALVLSYHSALRKGVSKNVIATIPEAITELNTARQAVGLNKVTLDTKKLTSEALKQSEAYYTALVQKGGSYVVEDHTKLVFKGWLKDLSASTKAEMQMISKKALAEGWNQAQIKEALRPLKESGKLKAHITAQNEIARQVDEAKRRTWAEGGLTEVQRHSVHSPGTCAVCASMDRRVYPVQDAPPLSHPNCRCYYSPYITKSAIY